MANKLQLSLKDEYREDLEQLIRKLGFTRGSGVNISGFIEAIACGELPLEPWSQSRQQTLLMVVWMLRDAGNNAAMQELTAILLERPELNEPIRAQLESYKASILSDWKGKIQKLIDNQTPFVLSYADATGEVLIYDIRYAVIVPRERHQYLDAWIESPDDSRDLPELAHNRSFRFDRIANAGVAPLTGTWRTQGLDTASVEFKLMGRLAHAYEPRSGDTEDRWQGNADVPTRGIRRNITNTFWFIREVLPYGKDCVVIAPAQVRDRVALELKAALSNYE